jgi:coenzyme F420-reducing hydrogenase alpha subunit
MAEDHPEAVRRGLALQGLGNALIRLCGARSVHPVGVCPGGFYHAPSMKETRAMAARLEAALPEAEATLRWTASLALPEDDQAFINVALRHADEYAIDGGRIASDSGVDVAIPDYPRHFTEYHEPHSTALYSSLDGQPYLVGPLARVNLNKAQLGRVAGILDQTGVAFPSRNMFHSIVARAAEVLYAIGEAMRLLQGYRLPQAPRVPVTPRAGVGFGATEAPRGLLWHRYEFDARGRVVSARIVPPTAQNQARMEQDLRSSLERYGLDRDDDAIRLRGETVIRNYDPCISCATHFLKVRIERNG